MSTADVEILKTAANAIEKRINYCRMDHRPFTPSRGIRSCSIGPVPVRQHTAEDKAMQARRSGPGSSYRTRSSFPVMVGLRGRGVGKT